ncbi:quinone oxidoreductase [Paenibacillus sp. J31TS4]|uniref:quinone oxidoreductase family protein n=1 Tax=Paenibacillus sp. J31TS4 TaxID=2807195 RepID=UPI001B02CE95|nr:NADPH:quinone oxidoreductase family protein [Paenibacillus sp. J31TS4]GIP39152.1 quinone oxidoreductase [Paenibacillus sp. J31TS4]
MKAVVVTAFGGPENLKMIDMEIPAAGPKQVLLRVERTSVNFADIKARYGQKGAVPPFIPGLDAAGVVVETGAEVTRFRPGQRVIAFPKGGSYAEYAVADEALTFAVPDRLDLETAAACPTVSFLSHKLLADVARLEAGEKVVVHAAAGGVGTTLVQMAKLLGAGTVIGTVGDESKAETAYEAGADLVLCYGQGPFAAQVNERTRGRGADIICDSVAGPVADESLHCLAPYGRLVQFGSASGQDGTFRTRDLHASCRSVLGFSLGTTRAQRPQLLQATAEQVLPMLADGRLKMKIGRTFALADAPAAHAWVESRRSTGKVLLVPPS